MHRNPTPATLFNSFIWATEDKRLLRKLREGLLEKGLISLKLTFGDVDIKKELQAQINEHQARLAGQQGLEALSILSEQITQSKKNSERTARLFNLLLLLALLGGMLSAFVSTVFPFPPLTWGVIMLLALVFLWAQQQANRKTASHDDHLTLIQGGISSLKELDHLAPGPMRDLAESRASAKAVRNSFKLAQKEQPQVDILILTPKPEEFMAAKKHLSSLEDTQHPVIKTNYTIGAIQTSGGTARIALQETGAGSRQVRSAAELGILLFQPSLVLLVGKAAGLKDAAIGDIVVGEKANGYEAGKANPDGFAARVKSVPYSYDLLEQIRGVAQKTNYAYKKNRILFGPIASGEKVVADAESEVITRIKSYMEDTLALEMEAIGLAEALHLFPQVRGVNIRGISDFADKDKGKMDKEGFHEQAIGNAAAFAFDFLRQLDMSQIKGDAPRHFYQPAEIFYYISGHNVIQGSTVRVKGDFKIGDLEEGG